MSGRLDGKVALVSGGARGIGLAICKRYAAEGAAVLVADIAGHDAAAAEIGHGAVGVRLDVTRQDSIDDAVAYAQNAHGRIDVLVNNAGVFDMGPLLDLSRESYRKVFAVNVEGLLFMSQAVARGMVERRSGKIVNFASQAGRRGEALVEVYCASKAAVVSLTQSIALSLAPHNIQVNGIAPGVVDTPMWDTVDALFAKHHNLEIGRKKREVGLAVPLGRMGTPEDMTGMAVFLASGDSDYVTAQTYNVDGGNWMS